MVGIVWKDQTGHVNRGPYYIMRIIVRVVAAVPSFSCPHYGVNIMIPLLQVGQFIQFVEIIVSLLPFVDIDLHWGR